MLEYLAAVLSRALLEAGQLGVGGGLQDKTCQPHEDTQEIDEPERT